MSSTKYLCSRVGSLQKLRYIYLVLMDFNKVNDWVLCRVLQEELEVHKNFKTV